MFVISCKYNSKSNYIIELVSQIKNYHPKEKIVIVDGSSDDKNYFEKVKEFNVIIEDIDNKNWMVGAYWHAFKKYPTEDFYFFLHDSMKIKSNLDHLKNNDLTLLATFNRNVGPSFNQWNDRIKFETLIDKNYINNNGKGCYGPIFFCKNKVMKKLLELNLDILLPTCKVETGYMEGAFGLFFETLGYDLEKCSLYGDILELESERGKSGPYPHNTSWQFPIEKFYASHKDESRK